MNQKTYHSIYSKHKKYIKIKTQQIMKRKGKQKENIIKTSKLCIITIISLCILLNIAGTCLNVTAVAAETTATVEEIAIATEEITTVVVEETTEVVEETTTVASEVTTQELMPMMARGVL